MKILCVSEKFYPQIKGGGELSAFYLLRELAKKHEIHVLTSGNTEKIIDGINIHGEFELPLIKGPIIERISHNFLLWLRILEKLGKYTSFDLIHAFNMSSIPSSVIFGNRLKIPIVATVNDHWATCFYRNHWQEGEECIDCNLIKMAECIQTKRKEKRPSRIDIPYISMNLKVRKLALKKVHRLVAVSNRVKEIMVHNGITSNKVDVIPNAIGKAPEYTEIGDLVVYIGRLEEGKGLDTLINAMAGVDGELRIVGDGSIKPRLEKLAKKNRSNVTFVGWVNPKEVQEYYRMARVIVCPFEREEPFSRIFLESLADGRPVIATDIGGARDIIDDEVGILIPPGDEKALKNAVQSLLLDKKKAIKLGFNGIKRVKKGYTPEIIAGKYEKVYKKVLAEK